MLQQWMTQAAKVDLCQPVVLNGTRWSPAEWTAAIRTAIEWTYEVCQREGETQVYSETVNPRWCGIRRRTY